MRPTLHLLTLRLSIITTALTAVLALLQYLRLGPILIEAGSAATALLPAAPLAVPALLTVTLPAGALIAALLTFRERSASREWLARRLQGDRLREIVAPIALFAAALSLLTALCAFWLAPLGLDRLATTLLHLHTAGRLVHNPDTPILLDRGQIALAASKARSEGDALHLTRPWLVRSSPTHASLMRAGHGVWDGATLELFEVDTLLLLGGHHNGPESSTLNDHHLSPDGSKSEPGFTSSAFDRPEAVRTSHDRVTVKIGALGRDALNSDSQRWLRYVPATEQLSTSALWGVASGGILLETVSPRRATVALLKRVVLSLAPLLLVLLAFPLSRPARLDLRGSASYTSVLIAVGVCGGYYAALRAGEVTAQSGAPVALVLALPVGVLGGAAALAWWRLWCRW